MIASLNKFSLRPCGRMDTTVFFIYQGFTVNGSHANTDEGRYPRVKYSKWIMFFTLLSFNVAILLYTPLPLCIIAFFNFLLFLVNIDAKSDPHLHHSFCARFNRFTFLWGINWFFMSSNFSLSCWFVFNCCLAVSSILRHVWSIRFHNSLFYSFTYRHLGWCFP